ncbi:5-formyltetrahydrofolate cyclo-ligase [Neobacillus sp. D3-1R]|uniref:5-formyltetrahydrofolate cyclo-ligase n=1 Tax=Neobacillus sp. D3-1R TaxID=3445778 RepID=UPI003F9F9610
MNKKEYRSFLIKELKKLTKQEYEQFSYEIANHLFATSLWKDANTIGITVSNFPEVDTFQIIRKAWEQNKRVVVPKCHPKDKQLSFHDIHRFTQLESVFYGLLEPIENETGKVDAQEIDLLVVPGLAYSNDGYRLGFGGGYYDRYLAKYRGNTISLAFPMQMRNDIPIEEHDMPVNRIISSSGM